MSTISQFYSEGKLLEELKCIFKDEDSIVDFHALLEKMRNFTNKSVNDRHVILTDLVFYKGELYAMRVKAEAFIHRIEAVAYNQCFESLKKQGLRPTDEMLKSKREELDLESTNPKYAIYMEQYRTCDKWYNVLNDMYFVLNSTNKILSNNSL